MIINFVKAVNNGTLVDENKENEIKSPKYLLNQILRQITIPSGNFFISKNAKQKWEEITSEDIKNYDYQKIVYCNNENQ